MSASIGRPGFCAVFNASSSRRVAWLVPTWTSSRLHSVSDSEEFLEIAVMPEDYIVHRRAHAANGAGDWRRDFHALTSGERAEFMNITAAKKITERDVGAASTGRLKRLLSHYVGTASADQGQLSFLND